MLEAFSQASPEQRVKNTALGKVGQGCCFHGAVKKEKDCYQKVRFLRFALSSMLAALPGPAFRTVGLGASSLLQINPESLTSTPAMLPAARKYGGATILGF